MTRAHTLKLRPAQNNVHFVKKMCWILACLTFDGCTLQFECCASEHSWQRAALFSLFLCLCGRADGSAVVGRVWLFHRRSETEELRRTWKKTDRCLELDICFVFPIFAFDSTNTLEVWKRNPEVNRTISKMVLHNLHNDKAAGSLAVTSWQLLGTIKPKHVHTSIFNQVKKGEKKNETKTRLMYISTFCHLFPGTFVTCWVVKCCKVLQDFKKSWALLHFSILKCQAVFHSFWH